MKALTLLATVLTLAVASGPGFAQGQRDRDDPLGGGSPVNIAESGRYTVRANAIKTEVLPAETAAKHGIERAPDRGLLSVVILDKRAEGAGRTVTADVSARRIDLLGQSETIAMRPVQEAGRVSYHGSFGFAPLRNLRFVVTVRPETGEPITLDFEDRFVAR